MKKYIKPEMTIFEAKPVEMICASSLGSGGSQENVNGEAPFRDFEDSESQFDFSNGLKLW